MLSSAVVFDPSAFAHSHVDRGVGTATKVTAREKEQMRTFNKLATIYLARGNLERDNMALVEMVSC